MLYSSVVLNKASMAGISYVVLSSGKDSRNWKAAATYLLLGGDACAEERLLEPVAPLSYSNGFWIAG